MSKLILKRLIHGLEGEVLFQKNARSRCIKYEGGSISSYKNTKNHIISALLTFIFQHSFLIAR